jgi:hypothetical protein
MKYFCFLKSPYLHRFYLSLHYSPHSAMLHTGLHYVVPAGLLIKYFYSFDFKSSSSRLAKFEKCEFTTVNDHFENKHNTETGLIKSKTTYFENILLYNTGNT